jgi:hypothetical protein
VDIGEFTEESGSGILSKALIRSDTGALAGVYRLRLVDGMHVDIVGNSHASLLAWDGFVAIGDPCPMLEPPSPAPTPGPPIIRGTVRDQSGVPVPFVTIVANGPGTVSGIDGRYQLILDAPGEHVLYASLQGYEGEYWNSAGGSVAAEDAEAIMLVGEVRKASTFTQQTSSTSGTVRDTQGNPIMGVTVSASGNNCCDEYASTDEQGHYEVVPRASEATFYTFMFPATCPSTDIRRWHPDETSAEPAVANVYGQL